MSLFYIQYGIFCESAAIQVSTNYIVPDPKLKLLQEFCSAAVIVNIFHKNDTFQKEASANKDEITDKQRTTVCETCSENNSPAPQTMTSSFCCLCEELGVSVYVTFSYAVHPTSHRDVFERMFQFQRTRQSTDCDQQALTQDTLRLL